ncbi:MULTISPECIES: hypothetical protein [Mesoplasma]|uniref:Uncharacterized protein n=1 Tax=Mesoplasma florum TaxID=2151 RepID=A0A2R3P712_MESFO|nr:MULTISPECIES: hypothetical protein [Mesoplasma]AVN64277.1 hypothetical protein CG003_01170 [Mesoplasma florum]
MNLILTFLFFIFSFNQNINFKSESKINNEKIFKNEIEYPSKMYSTNINFNQNLNNGDLWHSNYNYTFVVNLTDFKKYTFEYYDFKIEYQILERIIDKNNNVISTKNGISLLVRKEISSKAKINNYVLEEIESSNKIEYQSFLMADLEIKQDYKLTTIITNNRAKESAIKSTNLFKQRTLSVSQIEVFLIPKIEYEIFDNQSLQVRYDPSKIPNSIHNINKELNNKLLQMIDQLNLNSQIFFYFFSGIQLSNDNLNDLSEITPNLIKTIEIEFSKSYVIEKDAFLKQLTPPKLKVFFLQTFNISNLGLAKEIFVENYSIVNKEFLISKFGSLAFLFDEILFIEKERENKWIIDVKDEYKTCIYGTLEVNIHLYSNNWNESNNENIDSENPSWIDGEIYDENPQFKNIKESKYLKSIILFSISILMFSSILLPELLKKLKKKHRKNDKI